MGKLKTFMRLLTTDKEALRIALGSHFGRTRLARLMSDKAYLKLQYRAHIGHPLNLKDPKGFNEKLQWLKLYDRKPEYIQLVDKYRVRQWVAEKIGEEHMIPLLGVWERGEDIDFDALPERFVLKCNHDSGCVLVCKDKKTFDRENAVKRLNAQLKKNLFWWGREWPYKDVKPRIIAEAYMEDAQGRLDDYKFMCFDGEVKCSFVCSDRFTGKGLHVTFFDLDWNVMPFERSHPAVKEGFPKPAQYEKMVKLAQVLSKDIPFVRVDFYEVDGKIYFGEMTLYPGCGFEAFQPEQWDGMLGSWLSLPEKKTH